MRAAWYDRQGPAAEVIAVGDLPTPEAGPGEVRVKLAFSGVNPSDNKRRSGFGGQKMTAPRFVPHSDGAGTIDRVGAGVPESRIGERVWIYCGHWQRAFGTAAEYIAIRADHAIPLPAGVSFEAGACLGIPAVTAHRALFADGPVTGKTVLVTGGAGAVGNYAIQLARWGGAAQVIATVSSADKAKLAKAAGADSVVNYRTDDVAAAVLKATGAAGVDHVIEVAFGANQAATLAVLKTHGIVATYASDADPTPTLAFYAFMRKNAVLRWVYMYEIPDAAFAQARDDITAWLAAGPAQHPVARTFPLAQTAAAHDYLEAGSATGTVLVVVDA
jgi:NADPH2:quinone reductase